MATPRPKTSRRWIPRADRLLYLGLLAPACQAAAQGLPAAGIPAATRPAAMLAAVEETPLFLEVMLNGMPRGLQPFVWRAGELWAEAATLRQIGFVLPADAVPLQRLRALPGLAVDYDAAGQRVALQAPLPLLQLPTTVVGSPEVPAQAASASPGVLLNYDLYGTQGRGGSASLSAFGELRAFSGDTVFSTTALMQRIRGVGDEGWHSQSVRLDSTWSRSFPDEMLTLRVGDTLTGSLPWSRATRIGGVQLARNFALQPYRSTAPLPSFIGSATLPSEVELFVNGIRQYSSQVPAGPFQLNTLPVINSAGTAQVVLTDALGRATTLSFSMYDSGRLLAKGLTDWTVDLGVVRRNYGVRSFDYGSEPVATGTWRRGLSDSFTLEAHGEATRGLALGGVGGVWQLGGAGLVSAALAHSRHSAGSGSQGSLSYTWTRERVSASFSGTRAFGDYRDVAAQYGAAPPRATARASVGYSTAALGSFSLSYLYLRQADQPAARYASLGWFQSLGRTASLSMGFNQNLDKREERSFYLSLNWSLDSRTSVGAGVQHDGRGTTGTVSAQRSVPGEGGWGWRATARAGGDAQGGQADLDYLGDHGRLQAGVSDFGRGSRQAYAGATGALVLMGGHGFAARRIDDAFAVVSTDGVPDVPVRLENRPVGRTDARGMLLVVPVQAYQNNRLAIDPMQLPADVRIDRTETLFTPADRAGALVRFGIAPVRAASVQLVDAAGQPVPLGSRVRLEGQAGEGAVVGYDGMVYLEGLAPDNALAVHTPAGACTARFAWSRPDSGLAQIGPVLCLP